MLRLAFCLYEYSPFGGRERNCEATARLCAEEGHEVRVFTRAWARPHPEGIEVVELPAGGLTNIARDRGFVSALAPQLEAHDFDVVVGFDLLPGVDFHYAADPCFAAAHRGSSLARLTRRQMTKRAWERALFAPAGSTEILLLTERQRAEFRRAYGTPPERLHLLPPNLELDPTTTRAAGARTLGELGVRDDHLVLLFVGSDFQRKGLDRIIDALAELPEPAILVVVGEDDSRALRRRARRRGVAKRVLFAGGRTDVARFFARADLFVHPARHETAGVVLLEAMRYGVPVLTSEGCGFAEHVERAGGGVVFGSPWPGAAFRARLRALLADEAERLRLGGRGRAYVQRTQLHGRHERIHDLILERVRRSRLRTVRES